MNHVLLTGTLRNDPEQRTVENNVGTKATLVFDRGSSSVRLLALGLAAQELAQHAVGDGLKVEGKLVTSPEGIVDVFVEKVEAYRAEGFGKQCGEQFGGSDYNPKVFTHKLRVRPR